MGQAVQAGAAGTTASLAASEGVSQGASQVSATTIAQTSGLSQAFEAAKQAALTSTITQGIGVVTGLQSSFSWKGVIASAAGAGVSSALQGPLTQALPGKDIGTQILRSTLNATAAGTTTALLQGGKLNTVQIAADAFGNALGYAFPTMVEASARRSSMDVEARYQASAYVANAYSADDYDNNVGSPSFYSDTEANQDFAREQLRLNAVQTASAPNSINSQSRISSNADRYGQRDYMPALAEVAANASASLNPGKALHVEISGILPENQHDDPDTNLTASAWLDQHRQDMLASYANWQDESIQDGSATHYLTQQIGRFAANVGYDIGQGLAGFYDLATDSQTRAAALMQVRDAVSDPRATFTAIRQGLQDFAEAPFDEQADRFGRAGLSMLITGKAPGIGWDVAKNSGELTASAIRKANKSFRKLTQKQVWQQGTVIRMMGSKDILAAEANYDLKLSASVSTKLPDGTVLNVTAVPTKILVGDPNKIAVVGRSMDAVNGYAAALRAQGVDPYLFSSSMEAGMTIPTIARKEFNGIAVLNAGKIPDSILPNTKMFETNEAWAEILKHESYTVIDIGNSFNNPKHSIFFDVEQKVIFGAKK